MFQEEGYRDKLYPSRNENAVIGGTVLIYVIRTVIIKVTGNIYHRQD